MALPTPKLQRSKSYWKIYVRFEVFTSGRELAEAEELWEKVRQEAPRLNVLFDQEWFKSVLVSTARSRQLKTDETSSVNTLPNNLPQRLTSFVGRKKELVMLAGWLRPLSLQPTVRLVTMSGEGGCGKTSLALEVARELLPNYQYGVWLVELAALSTASGVTQALAVTLGLKEQAGSSLLVTIADYLREKSVLLVLDNCEHLIEECARVVDSLLRDCPQLVMLATSREMLKVSGETVFRVPSLTLPPTQSAKLNRAETQLAIVEELLEYEAIQLFVERGRSASPHFALTEQNQAVVAQLCRRLDGIPLAIELAAARLRVLNVVELTERLTDRFRLLKSGTDRTVLPRHQTLRATVDWSYELLSQPERLLFRRLAVFAGGWTLEAAEEICGLAGLETADVLDLLHELVNKSLVIVEEVRGVQPAVEDGPFQPHLRFRLLETLREYGQEQLKGVGSKTIETAEELRSEKPELQARHLTYYAAFAGKYVAPDSIEQTYDGGKSAELLATEHLNLLEALNWSTGPENQFQRDKWLLPAMQLALSTTELWYRRGYRQEASEYLSRLRDSAKESGLHHTSQYGWICNWLGFFSTSKHDYEQTQLILEEGLHLLQELGDKPGVVRSLHRLGMILKFQGKHREAYDCFIQGLTLASEIKASLYIIRNLSSAGDTCINLGELPKAAQHLQAGLKIARDYGDPIETATILIHLSLAASYQGENEKAIGYLQETLPLLKGGGSKQLLSSTLGSLGLVAFNQGDYLKADYYFTLSLQATKEVGSRRLSAIALNNLAESAMAQGNYKESILYQKESLALFQGLGEKLGIAISLSNMGNLERLAGNYETAAYKLQESLVLLQEMREKHYLFNVLLNMSNLDLDYFNLFKNQKETENKAYQHIERATRLAGTISSLLSSSGEKLGVAEQQKMELICNTGRQKMGTAAFERLFSQGQVMSLEEAIAYAPIRPSAT